MSYSSIAISSGHGSIVRGASGILDEVDEARKVVESVADKLVERGVIVSTFHDDISNDQSENLNRIVDWHNEQHRDLDISVHFNAFEKNDKPMGTEVLYVTQEDLAAKVSAAIATAASLPDRGAKPRDDLFFLQNTNMPAILIEVCFVDSSVDAGAYRAYYNSICSAIATALAGESEGEEVDPEPGPEPPRVDITITSSAADVMVFVNGQKIGTKG